MGVFRFPFNWGSETPTAVGPIAGVPVVPARWAKIGATAKAWSGGVQAGANPRFERIYAQPRSTFGAGINFGYQIHSQFPFIIASDTQVLITSTVTKP